MPDTARRHFDEDIQRSLALHAQAQQLAGRLGTDVRSGAIAMAVGGMDAYLCDAYVECLTSVLRAYRNGAWTGDLPGFYAKQQLPAGEVLDTSRTQRPQWGIRMAARSVMEKDNMLSIGRVKDHFNPILPGTQKIWVHFLPRLLDHGLRRLTGPRSENDINALQGDAKTAAVNKAIATVKGRLGSIIQVRHDWIHNCGRPKLAITTWTHGEAAARIRDIRIFVDALDDHLEQHRLA
jgi:hypothetical protein